MFFNTKSCQNHEVIISFCITFLQKLSRVMRHTKIKKFKKKQKVVKITKSRSFMEKHDQFILHDLFANSVPCNEAHKKSENSRKKRKVVKITKSHAFLGIDFENPKKLLPSSIAKSTTFGHF